MATSIPPHNLSEVINATLALIDNKDIKINELMKHIPGPDFPTGGTIIGKDIIKTGYKTGRGSFKVRGDVSIEQLKNGKERLVINSIPYQINKSVLNEKIVELIRNKKIEGINLNYITVRRIEKLFESTISEGVPINMDEMLAGETRDVTRVQLSSRRRSGNVTPRKFYKEVVKSDTQVKTAYRSYKLDKASSIKAIDVKRKVAL